MINNDSLQINNINTSGPQINALDVYLPNTSTFSDTLNFSLAYNPDLGRVSLMGPGRSTDTNDTIALSNVLAPNGLLIASANKFDIQAGNPVDASYLFLNSESSLAFATRGVPYLGSLTINAAPPLGQPFAGDSYLTGPDWGNYGYEPGDTITISGANKVDPTTAFTIEAIVGDNLYLNTALPSNELGNDTDVTVATPPTTPELEGTTLDLHASGPGSSISGAIDTTNLEGSTQNGNITLENVSSAGSPPPLSLEVINAGTGTIQLDANGPIEQGDGELTAGAVDLVTTGLGSGIGVAGSPIKTTIDGELTATTNDGGVFIADSGPGLTIDSIVADQGGQAPVVSEWSSRLQQHAQQFHSNLRFWGRRRLDQLDRPHRTELRYGHR